MRECITSVAKSIPEPSQAEVDNHPRAFSWRIWLELPRNCSFSHRHDAYIHNNSIDCDMYSRPMMFPQCNASQYSAPLPSPES